MRSESCASCWFVWTRNLGSSKSPKGFIFSMETMSASTKLKQGGLLALFGQSLISKAIYSAITIHYSLQCYPGCLSWDLPNPVKPGFSSCQNGEQSHNSPFAGSQPLLWEWCDVPVAQSRSPARAGGRRRFPAGKPPGLNSAPGQRAWGVRITRRDGTCRAGELLSQL